MLKNTTIDIASRFGIVLLTAGSATLQVAGKFRFPLPHKKCMEMPRDSGDFLYDMWGYTLKLPGCHKFY